MSPDLPLLPARHALLMAISVPFPLGLTTQCFTLEIASPSDTVLCLHTPVFLSYLYLSQDLGLHL